MCANDVVVPKFIAGANLRFRSFSADWDLTAGICPDFDRLDLAREDDLHRMPTGLNPLMPFILDEEFFF